MHLLKNISDANDKPWKETTLGLFVYLSKAFDTINRKTFAESEAHPIIGSTVISVVDTNTQNSIKFDL